MYLLTITLYLCNTELQTRPSQLDELIDGFLCHIIAEMRAQLGGKKAAMFTAFLAEQSSKAEMTKQSCCEVSCTNCQKDGWIQLWG